jgi:hypothetical protein
MPSSLVGLKKTLTWDDFKGSAPADDPHNAQTDASRSISGLKIKRLADGGVTIDDTITVTVSLKGSNSWVKSGEKTDALLNHEQGHYDIAALMARDFFIDLMQLKSQSFSNASNLQAELTRLQTLYAAQPISDKYDEFGETDHGRKSANQAIWDGFFRSAFTTPRVPAQSAPDGTAYKVRLRKVLADAGKI